MFLIIMIFKRCLIHKEMLFMTLRLQRCIRTSIKALKVYLIFIDIFLTGTDHGCQFSINVVAAHTLNISRILKLSISKLNISNSHPL